MDYEQIGKESGVVPEGSPQPCAMIKGIKSFFSRLLVDRHFQDDDELSLFLTLFVAVLFACSMNLVLSVLMISLSITLLAWVNLTGFLFHCSTMYGLLQRRNYAQAGMRISLTVVAYAIINTAYIGVDNYIILYYYIILLMQLVIPYARLRFRVLIIAMIWIAMILAIGIGTSVPPIYPISHGKTVLGLFNANFAFFAMILELSCGIFIRRYIAEKNEQRLVEFRSQAMTDELTGLHNRRYIYHLQKALEEVTHTTKLCVAMLDLDNFKVINDTMGHRAGDTVLRAVADTMRAMLRDTDILIRWGGDEFLVVLVNATLPEAEILLERLRVRLESMLIPLAGDGAVRCTVTIGATELDLEHIEDSIHACDTRLYEGKNHGKNSVTTGA